MTDGIGGTDGSMPQAHQLQPGQISAILRDLQRKNVALEKILSIVGDASPAGRVARDALTATMGAKHG